MPNITGLPKNFDGGAQLTHGQLLLEFYGTDARVDGEDVRLGFKVLEIKDLTDPLTLDAGVYKFTFSTRASSVTANGRLLFATKPLAWDLTADVSWGDIFAANISVPEMTPSLVQQAKTYRDEAEMFSGTTEALQDDAVEALVSDGASATRAALSATIASSSTAFAAASVTGALATGSGDVTILSLSDSTWNATDEALSLAVDDLAADWPNYGLQYQAWDDTTKTWGTMTQRVTGAGSYNIKVYNGGVAGETFSYALPNLAAMVTNLQPHLILINYGHNEGSTNNAPEQFRDEIVRLVETVRAVAPLSAVVVSSQNPRFDAGTSPGIVEMRTDVARRVCQLLGVGFIDAHAAFIATGDPQAYVSAVDGLHPTTSGAANGSRLWADVILGALRPMPGASPTPQPSSALLVPANNLASNGAFTTWATSPGAPSSWTLAGCTTEKDTTNYENANGYACKMVPTASGTVSMWHALPFRLLRTDGGQWVTAAARFWVPAGSHVNSGRVGINDGITRTSRGASQVSEQGGWKWEVFSRQIQSAATFARVYVYGTGSTTSTTDAVTCDRVWVGRGLLPHDAQ